MRAFAVLSLTSIGNHELHAGVHANGIIATVVFIEVCQLFQNGGLTETNTDTYTHVHASTHKHTDT
jgi:hypothetical protein